MNATIQVAAYYDCDHVPLYALTSNAYNPVWRQTTTGCKMLDILKDMYGFNVSYVITAPSQPNWTTLENIKWTTTIQNVSIDMFLRPLTLRLEQLDVLTPIHKAYSMRLGFILQHENESFYHNFYRNPFTDPLWTCLSSMAVLLSILFYLMKKCEFLMIGGFECSYPYELLMVIGGYCQHIPPIEAKLLSRRIAYLTFFFFAYTIYTYYTSNLLSHIVNDKDTGITLHSLAETHMEVVAADYIMLSISDYIPISAIYMNGTIKKLTKLRSVTPQAGLDGVKAGRYALLSDYISIYPLLTKTFTEEELCDISSVDIFSNIPKYFFVSKQLPYKEKFKIGLLRARETGILKRLLEPHFNLPKCTVSPLVQAKLEQMSSLGTKLLIVYAFSVLLLILERAYYEYNKRNKLWPFVH